MAVEHGIVGARRVDGTALKDLLTCERLAHFRLRPPSEPPAPPGPRVAVFLEAGRALERRRLEPVAPVFVRDASRPLADDARRTLALLAEGAPAVADGALVGAEGVGRPDLLLRDPNTGRVRVVEIKSQAGPSAASRLQAAFYARLLAHSAPEGIALDDHAEVWLGRRSRDRFPLSAVEATLGRALGRLESLASGPEVDPGPHLQPACEGCAWRRRCGADLEATDHVSRVPGLTRAQGEALRRVGLDSVGALAALEDGAALERAAEAAGFARATLARIRRDARAVLEGRPVPHRSLAPEVRAARLAVLALVHDRAEEPAVALAGRVMDGTGGARVRFVRRPEAADPDRELGTFLYHLVQTQGPVLTFGEGVRRLFDRVAVHGRRAAEAMARLRGRLVDLRAELRRAFGLPAPIVRLDRAAELFAAARDVDPDDALEVAALRHLEGLDEDRDAVERKVLRDLSRLEALRDRAVEEACG